MGLEHMKSSFGIKGKPLRKTSVQNQISKNGVVNTKGMIQHQNKAQGSVSPSGLNMINHHYNDDDVEFDED